MRPDSRVVFYLTMTALSVVLSSFGVAVMAPEAITGAASPGVSHSSVLVLAALSVFSLSWVLWFLETQFFNPLERVTRAIEESSQGNEVEVDPSLARGKGRIARLAKSVNRLNATARLSRKAAKEKKLKEFSLEKDANEVLKL